MAGKTKVKLSTVFSVIGAVGALLAIGGYLFSFGERIGRIETTVARLETEHAKTSSEIGTVKDAARSDVLKLAENARSRLREHEAIMQKMSESIVALTTEVRIRDRDSSVMENRVPVRVQTTKAAKQVDVKLRPLKSLPVSDDPLAGLAL